MSGSNCPKRASARATVDAAFDLAHRKASRAIRATSFGLEAEVPVGADPKRRYVVVSTAYEDVTLNPEIPASAGDDLGIAAVSYGRILVGRGLEQRF